MKNQSFEIKNCVLCSLYNENNKIVNTDIKQLKWYKPSILFVGEAPGADEAKEGIPFIGKSGKLLRQIISDAKIQSFAITNICRCKPRNNRPPTCDQAKACSGFLFAELLNLPIDIIVALGKTSCDFLKILTRDTKIIKRTYSEIRRSGMPILLKPPFNSNRGIPMYTVFHPSYIIRNGNKLIKQYLERFVSIRNLIDDL